MLFFVIAYASCKPQQTVDAIAQLTINQFVSYLWTPPTMWTWIISYATTWLYVMTYPQYFEESNDSMYMPKSKRWNALRSMTRFIVATATNIAARGEKIVEAWTKYKPGNRKLRRIRQYLARKEQRPKGSSRKIATLAMTVIAMRSMTKQVDPNRQREIRIDTDSGPIGIDNRCSGCISHQIDDFVDGQVTKLNRAIKGFGGTMNMSQGTLIWKWTDDNGELHRFEIPNSYYVPEGKVRLLSPQHWAQLQKDEKPIQGTGETTDAKNVTLFWNQRQNKLTVPINQKDNVATFKLASGYTEFHTFCAECEVDMDREHNDPLIADPTLISNNEVDNNQPA